MRVAWLLLCSSFALSACAPAGPPASAPSQVLDQSLPELSTRIVNGDALAGDALAHRVVVVKFFAKYCEPCKKTLPAAESLHQQQPDVQFIGVAEDEKQADVEEMIATFGLTFPVIHDPDNAVAGRFGVSQLPAAFVTDARGTVRWVGGPGQSESDLERAISWVKKPAP